MCILFCLKEFRRRIRKIPILDCEDVLHVTYVNICNDAHLNASFADPGIITAGKKLRATRIISNLFPFLTLDTLSVSALELENR